jgi:hypothetical protein
MENVWFLAALWAGLALIATLLAIWLKISTALSEIVVGTAAQAIIAALVGPGALGAASPWVTFLAGAGAIRPAPSAPRRCDCFAPTARPTERRSTRPGPPGAATARRSPSESQPVTAPSDALETRRAYLASAPQV